MSFDVSELGDVTVRDLHVRDVNVKENVEILGDLHIKGKLILDTPLQQEPPAPQPLPSVLSLECLELCDKENPDCKWRLKCAGNFLIYQKYVNGTWVNKQVVS